MATDDDDAAAKVYEQDYRFTDSEGDEIAYVYELGKDSKGDEFEIDLRAEGQPFSWVAVSIVKDLAKVDTCTLTLFEDFVRRAKLACKK
jgi:hypothetical protein